MAPWWLLVLLTAAPVVHWEPDPQNTYREQVLGLLRQVQTLRGAFVAIRSREKGTAVYRFEVRVRGNDFWYRGTKLEEWGRNWTPLEPGEAVEETYLKGGCPVSLRTLNAYQRPVLYPYQPRARLDAPYLEPLLALLGDEQSNYAFRKILSADGWAKVFHLADGTTVHSFRNPATVNWNRDSLDVYYRDDRLLRVDVTDRADARHCFREEDLAETEPDLFTVPRFSDVYESHMSR